ncbi:hypothetical protein LCGC14_1572020 [marine sediment metagenome]|uniref:Uncharacterized protein n=1 Tax=marine sediment metagenome TaxID=412755 RepID=A0A0F9IJB8_9ZZZZ
MSNRTWLYIALGSALVFVIAAIVLFADNKAEVITMIISGAVAVLAANASGKAKIKELDLRTSSRR